MSQTTQVSARKQDPSTTGDMSNQDKAQSAGSGPTQEQHSLFDKEGAVGKAFTAEGTIGGTAQSVGGPLAEDGAIGKHFKADGTLGGAVQNNLGDSK